MTAGARSEPGRYFACGPGRDDGPGRGPGLYPCPHDMTYRCPECGGPLTLGREQIYICVACWDARRKYKFTLAEAIYDDEGGGGRVSR